MDSIERLINLFEKFPGVGPRQAQRFVQFLLRSPSAFRDEFAELLQTLGESVRQCAKCYRYFSATVDKKTCNICMDSKRDKKSLLVVASDADLLAIEKSGTYRGLYFVLGGTVSLASDKTDRLRMKELLKSLPARSKEDLKEIILAFPANPEGDATSVRIREELIAHPESKTMKITALGRGLSTGSELEYADPETLKSALESRK